MEELEELADYLNPKDLLVYLARQLEMFEQLSKHYGINGIDLEEYLGLQVVFKNAINLFNEEYVQLCLADEIPKGLKY